MIGHKDNQSLQKAFSLIEVLLAMALFAVSMYLISQTFTNTFIVLETIQSDDDQDRLEQLVRQQVFTLSDRDEFEEGGQFPLPNGDRADWEVRLEETNLVDLFRCQLTITFPDAEPRTNEHWLLRPSWSEESERNTLLEDKKQSYQDRYGAF